jgi:hypothetical protein
MYSAVAGEMQRKRLFISKDHKQQSRLAGALVPLIAIASGKGVLVQFDSETYCYNYGYHRGSGGSDLEADKENRRTGRSYGASIVRNSFDPTDVDYLEILGTYVASSDEKELRRFYTTLFSILLKSDTSGIKTLAPDGQTVLVDFLAIYMAELDRHLMTGLKKYEWENALTEITLLAAFSASDQGITLDPTGEAVNTAGRRVIRSNKIKPIDRMVGFFGVGTDGSGLDGMNKERRHGLTRQVSRQVAALNPKSGRSDRRAASYQQRCRYLRHDHGAHQ